jgi:hypothetical protein
MDTKVLDKQSKDIITATQQVLPRSVRDSFLTPVQILRRWNKLPPKECLFASIYRPMTAMFGSLAMSSIKYSWLVISCSRVVRSHKKGKVLMEMAHASCLDGNDYLRLASPSSCAALYINILERLRISKLKVLCTPRPSKLAKFRNFVNLENYVKQIDD